MAFTLTFPSSSSVPSAEEIAEWLTSRGEPFAQSGPTDIALKALPVRLLVDPEDDALVAHLEVTPEAPLSRLVNLLFGLSIAARADVRLAGHGDVTRADLWLRLADEQDRLRIAKAIEQATEHGNRQKILSTLWTILSSASPGQDVRWDVSREQVVEILEVEVPGGIPLEEARWHDAEVQAGDPLPVPVEGHLHILAWRWLSAAYPALAD